MIEWLPAVKVVIAPLVAMPPLRVPLPIVVAPSLKVTVPVAPLGVKVAVKVTEWPGADGFKDEVKAIAGVAFVTVRLPVL